MRGDPGFPVRLRFAKRGKVRFISHRDVARALRARLPHRAAARSRSPRVLAPPEGQLRAGALGRPRERRRVPRRRAHRARRHRRRSPSALTPALPEGMPATGAVRLSTARPPCRNRSPRSSTGSRPSTAVGRPSPDACSPPLRRAPLASDELARHPHPQGQGERGRSPSRAPCHRGRVTTATRRCSSSPCRPNPVVPVRVRCSTPSTGSRRWRRRPHRAPRPANCQWIERGGARLEPLEADAFAPALEASAS